MCMSKYQLVDQWLHFIFEVLEDPYIKCLTENLAEHMQVIITERLLCVWHYAKCFSLYVHSTNVNSVLFFLLVDRLEPKLVLWKLNWAVKKISFHEGKNCHITGCRKLLCMGCKDCSCSGPWRKPHAHKKVWKGSIRNKTEVVSCTPPPSTERLPHQEK